jgi:hypothetical protein
MPKSKPATNERPRWNWANGFRAAAWSAICVEAILAGGDRPCMPSFSLNTLLGHMLIMNEAGVGEFVGLCAAVPAFVAAAYPRSLGLDPNRRNVVMIALAVGVLVLQLFVFDPITWVPALGIAIGALIRWYPWARTYWLPLALASAIAFGVIQFSGLEYGQSKCWH